MKIDWSGMNRRWGGLTLSLCIAVAFYVVLTHFSVVRYVIRTVFHFFLPVVIGVVIAYVVNPLVSFLRRTLLRGIRADRIAGRLSAVISLLLIIALLIVLLVLLIPQLMGSIVGFVDNLDIYVAGLQRFIHTLGLPSHELEQMLSDLVSDDNGIFSRVVSMISNNIDTVLKASTDIGSSAFTWLLGFVLAIYFLVDKMRIRRFAGRMCRLTMSDSGFERFAGVWYRFNEIFTQYIVCELLDSLIVGVSNYIFMKITGMPYALLVSVVVGVANLAPTFGPIAGAVIGAFILLLARPILVVWFLIFTIILQFIDGYILKPKMFGDVLNVPSLLILVAIIVGGRMFGVIGILLAIPCAAILEYLYRELLIPRLQARRIRKYGRPAPEPPAHEADESAHRPDGTA